MNSFTVHFVGPSLCAFPERNLQYCRAPHLQPQSETTTPTLLFTTRTCGGLSAARSLPHPALELCAPSMEAETWVKKLSIEDKRMLVAEEGVWEYKPPDNLPEYLDPIESTRHKNIGETLLNMPITKLEALALEAAKKRLDRGEASLVSIHSLWN